MLFGKHPMAPVISPKKSWEGFAGSLVFTVAAGWALVVYLLDGDWWVGICLGLIAVVMATLGDLCESVMKRDLGIKDMSQVMPGPRRPDGPARLAAGHDRPDLAAAPLRRLLSRRSCLRSTHVPARPTIEAMNTDEGLRDRAEPCARGARTTPTRTAPEDDAG